jgi:alkylhydroperoxidase family enzyme
MGLTEEKIQKIKERDPAVFSALELLVLQWSDLILKSGKVENKEQIAEKMKEHFDNQQIVELSTFIALTVGFIPMIHTLEL